MKKTFMHSAAALALIFSVNSFASPAPTDPKKQTPQGLYADSKETYAMMKKDPSIILVDVRTPAEWQFVGYTPMAQIMIPSVNFDFTKMDDKKARFADKVNENFVAEFEAKLFDLGADKNTTYVLMCRSGSSRAQPAAKMLYQYGYKNVYIMTDGFEGGKLKSGEHKGYRLKAGWKYNNLPWSWKIDPSKVYTPM